MSKQGAIAFVADGSLKAQEAWAHLSKHYAHTTPDQADILVVLGGDGFMLKTLRAYLGSSKKFYGINCGHVGFLLNSPSARDLYARLEETTEMLLRPLQMTAHTVSGACHKDYAINEVSIFRKTHQTAKLRVKINGRTELEELVCDGLLLATPAGSTAYNFSAHGPILPMTSNLLALTPVSVFSPRRFQGALLPHTQQVTIDVLDPINRPVAAVADNVEVDSVERVEIREEATMTLQLLFDADNTLEEKILKAQFTR